MTVAELEMRRQQLLMQQQQQQAVLDAARAQAEANGGGAPTGATAKAINAMQKVRVCSPQRRSTSSHA